MAAAEVLVIARGIDDKVKGVDDRVGSVIQGERSFRLLAPESDLTFHSVRCSGDRSSDPAGVQSSRRPKPFVDSSLPYCRSITKALPFLQVTSCARTFENGSLPQIHPLITTLRPMLIMRVPQHGAPRGTPSQIGKHLVRCYGYMENVHTPLRLS
jgi:hypothetical protein